MYAYNTYKYVTPFDLYAYNVYICIHIYNYACAFEQLALTKAVDVSTYSVQDYSVMLRGLKRGKASAEAVKTYMESEFGKVGKTRLIYTIVRVCV